MREEGIGPPAGVLEEFILLLQGIAFRNHHNVYGLGKGTAQVEGAGFQSVIGDRPNEDV